MLDEELEFVEFEFAPCSIEALSEEPLPAPPPWAPPGIQGVAYVFDVFRRSDEGNMERYTTGLAKMEIFARLDPNLFANAFRFEGLGFSSEAHIQRWGDLGS